MARVLLGPYQGVSQGRRLTQHIRNRADGGAGISEDMLHSFPLQASTRICAPVIIMFDPLLGGLPAPIPAE